MLMKNLDKFMRSKRFMALCLLLALAWLYVEAEDACLFQTTCVWVQE